MKLFISVHHIGYAVHDIEKTAEYYINADWLLSEIIIEKVQNVKIAYLSKEGFPLIELVAPIDENSPIVKTLEKSGVTPYHVCYEVDDIDETIEALYEDHFMPLFEPIESTAMENRKICYLYNLNVGLIEIVNKK
jgi:methylmalonyl-CoA/ethylmalonyl-CoA epimerase